MVTLMHVLAGVLALTSGYVALAAAKGAGLHRRSGRIFVATMLLMAGSGTAIAIAFGAAPGINVPAGLLTAYLVVTALTTVRPATPWRHRVDLMAMATAIGGGLVSIGVGIAAAGAAGRGARSIAVIQLVFGGIALLAGLADVRVWRSAPLVGVPRLRRHLWRMSTALFIASMAFFLGQADEFPPALRIRPLLALPVLAVLVTMLYWLWRVRRPGAIAAAVRPVTRRPLPALDLDDDDFEAEIDAHLAMARAERIAEGADPEAAHYAALKEFGNVTATTEAARRVWTPWWLEAARDLTSDIRYAVRSLAAHMGFTFTVISVLALGIGLNAAVFTMLKGIALTPLAGVERSAQLYVIHGETSAGRVLRLSYPDYLRLRDQQRSFVDLFGSALANVTLGRGRGARPISAELVTGNYFQTLGIGAQRGRVLTADDEIAAGRHQVAVLSDSLWRRQFGADPDIVGRSIEINNVPLTVVGVTDASYHGTIVTYDIEVFIPLLTAPELGFKFGSRETTPAAIIADRTAGMFYPQGFLRPGVSATAAAAEGNAHWSALAAERPLADAAERLRVVPFSQSPGSGQTFIMPTLLALSGMGLLVLMIACANIAGLVLVRGVSRRGEIAVRLALGAPRLRIVRLLVLENLVLAAPGAALGILLSWRGIPPLVAYADWLAAPQRLYFNIQVDGLVIAFAAAVACICAVVFGLVPALQSSRVDLVSVINADASPRGAPRSRLRAALVVAQVAVSLLLMVGASLAMRSVEAARRTDPGFDPNQLIAVDLDVRQNGYDAARGRQFYRRLLETARTDVGIESATLSTEMPLSLLDSRAQRVAVEGYEPARDENLAFLFNTVGPDYLRTLRIGLLAGREFEDRDDDTGPPVALVNATLAQRFWGGAANAVGKRIRLEDGVWRSVVGVAADVKYARVNEAPRPYVYVPFFQAYRSAVTLHTRGPAAVDVLLDQAAARVEALDPDLPISSARPATESIRGAFIFYQLAATMLLVFGAAGMALAALGTYGLVSHVVTQSRHEIGIRLALGATSQSVLRRFLGRGLRLGAIGALVGTVAALGVGRLLERVLFGVTPTDPVSFSRATAVVLAAVALATLVPAWRAARTDPLRALRHQ
jgi:macrolide transport system ATP-binding/permease protein